MRKKLYFFVLILFCFFGFASNVKAEILYDITNFYLTDNTLTLNGWGLIHRHHNGNLSGGYANTYKFQLTNSSGQVVRTAEYKYANTSGNKDSWANSLSLTCFLNEQTVAGDNARCSTFHDDFNLTERNKIIMKGTNYYYDMINFKAVFNDMNTLPDDEYKISMTIISGYDGYSETENELYIIEDYVTNTSSIFDTSEFTGSLVGGVGQVIFIANNAMPGNFKNMDWSIGGTTLGGIEGGCYFTPEYKYNVWGKDELRTQGGATFYKYQLEFSSHNGSNCGRVWDDLNSGNKAGAYAVWVKPWGDSPILIKRKELDPCADGVYSESGVQIQTAKEYAYSNPGMCCDTTKGYEVLYETCCQNTELIKNQNIKYLDFCCKETEYEYYMNSDAIKLPTFKYYSPSTFDYETNIIGPSGICPTCDTREDYNYDEDTDTPSSCCLKYPENSLAYNEDGSYRCEKTNPVCSDESNQCYNSDYFEKNTACCCGLYGSESGYSEKCKIGPTTWKTNLSCKDSPNANTIIANTPTGVTDGDTVITEKVTFTNYTPLDVMKKNENIIKSGTGLDYKIDVQHTVTRTYNGVGSSKTNPIDFGCQNYTIAKTNAENYYYNTIAQQLNSSIYNSRSFDVGIKNFLTSNNTYKFNSIAKEDYYTLVDNTFVPNTPIDGSRVELYFEAMDWPTIYGCVKKTYSIMVPLSKEYIYNYSINFKDKFISKLDTSVVTDVTTDKKEYLDGYNRFYTETTTETGVYDFNITVSNGGVTGRLNTTTDGFSCQYGVVNKFYNNGIVDCSPNEFPCSDDNDTTTNGRGFYFRQISLFDPFPNGRTPGKNWRDYYIDDEYRYITHSGENDSYGSVSDEKGDSVYIEEPMYEVTLDADLINQIKKYNKSIHYDYGWQNMTNYAFNNVDSTTGNLLSSTSNFLSGIGGTSCYNNDICDKIDWNSKLSKISDTERQNKVGDFE